MAKMVQKVVELSEDQAEHLERLAELRRMSVGDLLGDAVDRLLHLTITWARPTEEKRRRARALSGAFSSGLTDIAENHDRYLVEAFSHDHLR